MINVEFDGDINSLGRIKFETTSDSYIYLHDTNAKWLFNLDNRARSSGCVRVDDPETFASLLSGQDKEAITENIDSEEMFWERVPRTPVYFLYDILDFKVNGEDQVHRGDDVYGKFSEFQEQMTLDYEIKEL